MPENANQNRQKFQELLKKLFQFESADLDFGIYRVLNYKRDAIEKFIERELLEAVSQELKSGALGEQAELAKQIQELAGQLRELLGDDALDANGHLLKKHEPLLKQKGKLADVARKHDTLMKTAGKARPQHAVEAAIFNHLYTFFSRYYDAGDFMSKRRYSKKEKYAVPYNGEEVHLHWANKDQYYIKTGEYFTDYRFVSRGLTVHFKLQAADVEKDNIKGDKRFFLPLVKKSVFDRKDREVVIPFEYRPLTEQEEIKYGQKNQQDSIIAEALESVPKHFAKEDKALSALMAEKRKTSEGEPVSCLEYHLRQYTRRNTSDFFIHKDLKGFLERELDFYLKNEVLNVDDLEAGGEGRARAWFQTMRVMKAVGSKVIAFLAQIENFQKKLFEKRKFVTETTYCITMAVIPEEFYGEVVANDAQWEEWKKLFHIDEEKKNVFSAVAKNKKESRVAFLRAHPTLVLDTRYFPREFIDCLLASIDGIDDKTDGLIVKGENFQGLGLLAESLRDTVKCIYADPPFNTGGSNFLYKNGYRHSSWCSMIANVLDKAIGFLSPDGVTIVAIDDYEIHELGQIMDKVFGEERRLGILVVENKPSGRTNDMFFGTCHEYYLCYARNPEKVAISFFPLTKEEKAKYKEHDGVTPHKWRDFLRTGGYSTPKERPNSYYPIYLNRKTGKLSLAQGEDNIEILPIDSRGQKRVWRKTKPSFLEHLEKGEIRAEEVAEGKYKIEIIDRIKEGTRPKSVWVGARYDAATHGTKLLKDILGDANTFDFPKSVHAVRDAVYCVTSDDENKAVMDIFAGSGTTGHSVIILNREDGGNRKFILMEMADYVDTVILPRMKKVIFSPEWKDGKPIRQATAEEAHRSPRIIKYVRIESYEDALNNIAFTDKGGHTVLTSFDDYLLNYMIEWETKDSDTLLNVEKLATPFSYNLLIAEDGQTKEKQVDLPETFNYLLGLRVQSRKVCRDKDRAYLVYRGTVDSRQVAVIWRETKDWKAADFKRDKKFVAEQKLTEGADEVFVNSDSVVPGAKSLDPVFKARMFAPVAAGTGGN